MARLTKKRVREMVKADYTMFYRAMPAEIRKLYPVITIDILKEFGFSFTTKHGGKMTGLCSLSTSCKTDPICRKRIEKALRKVDPDLDIDTADPDRIRKDHDLLKQYIKENPEARDACICGFCFADSQQNYQSDMIDPLTRNAEILNNGIIHPDWLPALNNLYFRIESFGDVSTVNACINILHMIERTPGTRHAVWSKNIPLYRSAIRTVGKPGNMVLLKSTEYINAIPDPETDPDADIVDMWFSVITPEFAEAHGLTINCGARACLACLHCYTGTGDRIRYERLK